MVILRKLALRVQANLGAHSSKIKNAASLLEAPFEPFNFHWDMCVLNRDSSSVRAPAGASGGTAFNVRSLRQPFDDDAAQRFHQTGPQSSGIGSECPALTVCHQSAPAADALRASRDVRRLSTLSNNSKRAFAKTPRAWRRSDLLYDLYARDAFRSDCS